MTNLRELFYWHVRRPWEGRWRPWIAHNLPRQLRRAVLADAAARATTPPAIEPDDYAGPDGVTYKRMWDAS